MGRYDKNIEAVSKEDFFEINAKYCSKEDLAEKVYIWIHTYYLIPRKKMLPLLGDRWEDSLGIKERVGTASFKYLKNHNQVLITDTIREDTRRGMEINKRDNTLDKGILSLEFDLWMIENRRAKRELSYDKFEEYIRKKYGRRMGSELRDYKEFNLCYINKFEAIAEALDAHYNEILEFFELISKNNRMRIYIDNIGVERVRDAAETLVGTEIKGKESVERYIEEKEVKQTVGQQGKEVKTEEQIRNNNNFEYEILVKDMQERIDKLERDIKEFKRQRDDAREYSVNQYDKGIKDLFSQMNDLRYGKVIDYFYSLLKAEDTEENLASYLDNFFMILEDMEIEPIVGDEDVVVTESNLTKEYNLDFDKKEYVEGGTEIKYVGWKYKDIPMEKPTLKLKER